MNNNFQDEYDKLVEKAKDCAVFYGIYSTQYADAVRNMNDFWLENQPKKLTFKEKVIIQRNKYVKKWTRKNY